MLAHADLLYNLARYLTGAQGDAEDLVQETFIRALRTAGEFEDANLKGWLLRILRNAFYDSYRREKKHRAVEPLDEETIAAEGWQRTDSEVEVLQRAAARDVEAAMMRLPADGRTVLLLDLEGFTETEISDIMNCPVGTVKSRLMRARANLRKQLCQYAK